MKIVKCLWLDMYPDRNFVSCPCGDRDKDGFCRRFENCQKFNLMYFDCECMKIIKDIDQISIFDLT